MFILPRLWSTFPHKSLFFQGASSPWKMLPTSCPRSMRTVRWWRWIARVWESPIWITFLLLRYLDPTRRIYNLLQTFLAFRVQSNNRYSKVNFPQGSKAWYGVNLLSILNPSIKVAQEDGWTDPFHHIGVPWPRKWSSSLPSNAHWWCSSPGAARWQQPKLLARILDAFPKPYPKVIWFDVFMGHPKFILERPALDERILVCFFFSYARQIMIRNLAKVLRKGISTEWIWWVIGRSFG